MLLIPIDFTPILGTFIRRLNRFMVLAEVGGEHALAHLPNSGRLATVLYPGVKLYLRKRGGISPKKSMYRVFAASHNDITVIVDSHFSNYLIRRAIEQGLISELAGYSVIKENVRPEGSNNRIDFLLTYESKNFYLEVKSVTHVLDGVALFPDAPTLRGRRQLIELLNLLRAGFKAGIIFSIQRPDATCMRPNYGVDPEFANLLKVSIERGLKVFTLRATFIPGKGVLLRPNEPRFSF